MEKELIKLDDTKSIQILNNDFDTFKKGVVTLLNKDEYNSIVTLENMDAMKITATLLNKTAGAVSDFRIAKIKSESVEHKLFGDNLKDITTMFSDKRKVILDGVEVFEDETRLIVKDALILFCEEVTKSFNIRDEFNKVDYSDLIALSAITPKGALKKGTTDKLTMRIQACKSKQDKYDMRVMGLENTCFRLGLTTPLTVEHIQGIVNIEDDEDYNFKLSKLINDELKRFDQMREDIVAKESLRIAQEATQKLNFQKQLVNNTFLNTYGMLSIEALEIELKTVTDYNLNEFDLCLDYAKTLQDQAITKINQCIWGKKKALEDTADVVETLVDKKPIDNPTPFDAEPNATMRDKKPFVQKEEPIQSDNIQSHNELTINVSFKVMAPVQATKEQIKKAIRSKLIGIGVTDESLISLEVV